MTCALLPVRLGPLIALSFFLDRRSRHGCVVWRASWGRSGRGSLTVLPPATPSLDARPDVPVGGLAQGRPRIRRRPVSVGHHHRYVCSPPIRRPPVCDADADTLLRPARSPGIFLGELSRLRPRPASLSDSSPSPPQPRSSIRPRKIVVTTLCVRLRSPPIPTALTDTLTLCVVSRPGASLSTCSSSGR